MGELHHFGNRKTYPETTTVTLIQKDRDSNLVELELVNSHQAVVTGNPKR